MNKLIRGIGAAAGLALATTFAPPQASACGGFFCSQTAGVNQAAERIVFAQNDDGTVTAVIEIQYQGPSNKFSWLLPISSVPMGDQIAVASSLSFQRLQQATNPQYNLTRRVEGTCDEEPYDNEASGGASDGFASGGASAGIPGGGVTVEASGLVGSFEWTVISVDPTLTSPADAAVNWLQDNGYDVPQGAPGLLGPYLADGLHLLALRLQKGATTGSIRPIVLTYDATKPMIPIKLTAVAASDNMGVMAWVLGDARAVPKNYNALELNDARINWFNANANYNNVVTAAADEAGGQGFVTEYAEPSSMLKNIIWSDQEERVWQQIKTDLGSPSPQASVTSAMNVLSAWDGFWEVFEKHVSWSANVTLQQIQQCPYCYQNQLSPDADFASALESDVVEPARTVQKLLDAHPQVTRLYSTLSAPEMTVDPLFTFNPTLPAVSNIHSAAQVIECGRGYYESEAPWRIELPQGGVVRGGPTLNGSWPAAFNAQPANRRILRESESGSGKVLEDNSTAIDADISTYSESVPTPPHHPAVPSTRGPTLIPGSGGVDGSGGNSGADNNDAVSGAADLAPTGGCGCRVASSGHSSAWLLVAVAGVLGGRRRRARRQQR
jgi:MYXO-CTERM domain-containing protein